MAGSVNKVILIGNLGADPEVRRTNAGEPVVTLSLATGEQWRDKATGEKRERTEWHRVVIFNPNLCEVAEKYLRKGSKAYVEGQMQTRKWQAQDGSDRWTTEVVVTRFRGDIHLLDKAEQRPAPSPEDYGRVSSGGGDGGGDEATMRAAAERRAQQAADRFGGEMDDEIPF